MAIQYYMRAFNTTLARYVDWVVNDTPDSTGQFSGYPTNQLLNITVNRVVQSKIANFLKPNQSLGGTDGNFFHVNSYDWKNATAPILPPTAITGVAVERGISSQVAISGPPSGATNTSPITITTSANHNLSSGQIVTIIGVTGNTNANGTWPITVTGLTTFTLNGSTGNGAQTSQGSGVVYVPTDTSVLGWDEINQLWRFFFNTHGDGTTVGSSQSLKINTMLMDGYLAIGPDPADTGAVRLSNNTYIFSESNPAGTDIQLIGGDLLNRIKLGVNPTDIVYNPGVLVVDGYIQHDGTGSNTAQTTGFIREQNGTNIIAVRGAGGLAGSDIVVLGSNSLNNIFLGDAVNTGVLYNTSTGNIHQFQVGSVPQFEIGTSFARFNSGVSAPTVTQGTSTVGSGQTLTVQAQAALAGTNIGGALSLASGAAGNAGSPTGTVDIYSGNPAPSSLKMRVFPTVNSSTDSNTIKFFQNVAAATPAIIRIDASQINPLIRQDDISGASGQSFTLQAQNALTVGLNGGNVIVNSGNGTTPSLAGNVLLETGGTIQVAVTPYSPIPPGTFATTNGTFVVCGNFQVQGSTTITDSTVVDIIGRVIHANWSDPTSNPNVSRPSLVAGYSVHRGNLGGQPRDGASLIWTEGATGSDTYSGVTAPPTISPFTLYASDGYWRAITTPGDGYSSDGYVAGIAINTLGMMGNHFVATVDPNPALGTLPAFGGLRMPNYFLPSSNSSINYQNSAVVTRNSAASSTLVVSGTTPLTLPQATLTVVSATGFTSPTGSLLVMSSAGPQLLTYTGITGNQFTGVSGGTGTIVTGNIVAQAVNSTTIAAGSNGLALPQTSISVASTVGFPQSGSLRVLTSNGNGGGIQTVTYSAISGNTFTGVSGGTGVMLTGNPVLLVPPAGNADMHLLGSDFGNRILHGLNGLANSGHVFNTSTGSIYDFQVNSVSQVQITGADINSDGYIELIQVAPTVANPRIYQLAQPYTGANAGFNMMLQAQAGQNVTAGTNNNGGILTLASGPAGTGGTGGVAGVVTINVGSVNNSTFNNIDPDGDGYAEWLAIGPTILNPRLYQATLPGTGTAVGTNFKINAQAGQNVAAGTNNNGGNLVLASGTPGTGGTGGTPGQIEMFYGSTLELTLTDGSLQWSNLITNPPIISQADGVPNGQTMTMQAQNGTATGGILILTSGTGATTATAGNVKIETGGVDRIITYPTGSPANLPSPASSNVPYTEFRDTAQALFIVPVSAGTTSIGFASTVTTAQIAQVATTGTTGAPMTVQAQTGATGTGGALSLIAGNATTTGGALNLASGSGTTNGVINFQPGGTTQILITATGQFIQWVSTMANPTINQATTGGASGTTLTVQAQNAATTGGNLALTSGTGTTAGNVNLQTGAATRVSVNPTFTSFLDTAEALRIVPVSAGTTEIRFASTDTAVLIDQTTTAGATGANTTIQAQNAATTGGNAIITSGTGGTTAGNAQLQTGGVDRVVVHPTFTEFRDTAEALRITPVSAGTTQITFASTDTAAQINQTALASGTGATMTVQAQSGGTGTGGDLNLSSGSGTTTNGNLNLQAGGSTTARVHTNKLSFLKGWRRNVTSVTGTYSISTTDDYIVITSLNTPYTISLPASPTTGDTYLIKDATGKAAINNVNISGNGNTIDGVSNWTINQAWASVIFTFAGGQWSVT